MFRASCSQPISTNALATATKQARKQAVLSCHRWIQEKERKGFQACRPLTACIRFSLALVLLTNDADNQSNRASVLLIPSFLVAKASDSAGPSSKVAVQSLLMMFGGSCSAIAVAASSSDAGAILYINILRDEPSTSTQNQLAGKAHIGVRVQWVAVRNQAEPPHQHLCRSDRARPQLGGLRQALKSMNSKLISS